MSKNIILLATVETKAQAVTFLTKAMKARGLGVTVIDLSLCNDGEIWSQERKKSAMASRVKTAIQLVQDELPRSSVVVAMGGGTGGEMGLLVLDQLSLAVPKILLTTLPFDPRPALARNRIILVPSLADIEGLNTVLDGALALTADIALGLSTRSSNSANPENDTELRPSIGLTTLGATQGAASRIGHEMATREMETIAFHANGFGGASLIRFALEGGLRAVIDLTPHEITRLEIAGDCIDMPNRFSSQSHLPRVLLPGALNFLGLGVLSDVSPEHKARPHYQHSNLFTHVKLTHDEAARVCTVLAGELNKSTAPCSIIMPMGGFSHEDRPGGAIEDAQLRMVAAETLSKAASAYDIIEIPHHINDSATATLVGETLHENIKRTPL